jgi:hypothetical protein
MACFGGMSWKYKKDNTKEETGQEWQLDEKERTGSEEWKEVLSNDGI